MRSWLGFSGNSATAAEKEQAAKSAALVEKARNAGGELSHEEQLAKIERAQSVQLKLMKSEFERAEEELKKAVATGNRSLASVKLQDKKRIEAQISAHTQKLENTRAQQKALQTANINLAQVVTMKDGALELDATAKAMESLNVKETIMSIKKADAKLKNYDSLLTRPLFDSGGSSAIVQEYEANAELDALMAEQADRNHLLNSMPAAPTTTVAATATAAPTAAVSSSAVKEGKQDE